MRILIVDDDEDVVAFLSEAARGRGHTHIDTAQSAEAALACAVRSEYDLITLDIRMPGASGLEILSMLRNMSPHAVIALVSGYFTIPMPEDTAGCADALISKPIAFEKLTGLLDGADQIVKTMANIRALGDVATE
jgi:DNA-binding NtrC family response regulator